jgi:agmatine deiminase
MDRVARILAETELVYINAHSNKALRDLEQRFEGVDRIRVCLIPTNDAWIRDHGATFVTHPDSGPRREPEAARPAIAIDWRYNAWGGKYPPWELDDDVARAMADFLGVPCIRSPLHCEGGALEVDGEGLLMTTASCLLNPNRNPAWTQPEVEKHLRAMLGVEGIIWLPGTELAGDDTDGHIDNLARFVGDGVVLVSACVDAGDENSVATDLNLEYLRTWRSLTGSAFDVRELPLPRALYYDARRLPASYANFYIANDVVIVPTYGQADRDDAAIQIIGEHFPARRVVGINSVDLVWGLGSFHCLTQQVPL